MHPSFRVLQIFVRNYGWTAGVWLLRGHLHWQEHYLCALLDCTWCRCAFECLLGGSFALKKALFVCIALHNAHAFTRASFFFSHRSAKCTFELTRALFLCACLHYFYTLVWLRALYLHWDIIFVLVCAHIHLCALYLHRDRCACVCLCLFVRVRLCALYLHSRTGVFADFRGDQSDVCANTESYQGSTS